MANRALSAAGPQMPPEGMGPPQGGGPPGEGGAASPQASAAVEAIMAIEDPAEIAAIAVAVQKRGEELMGQGGQGAPSPQGPMPPQGAPQGPPPGAGMM